MEEKTKIRKEIAAAVARLTAEEKEAAAHALVAKAALTTAQPGVVAAYMPLPDELDTLPLLRALEQAGRRVVIPKVQGGEMDFYDYSEDTLECGAWGIAEPVCAGAPVSPQEIDLMFVPGRAFTAEGARLGRGKGFYDKYMSREGFRAHTVGVCYQCQMLDQIPTEPHDRRVDEVLAC